MQQDPKKLEELILRKYFEKRRIVISDGSTTSRSTIGGTLTSMGAKMSNIALTGDYPSAEQVLSNQATDLVIADYDLGRRCGLDLLQKQRALKPDARKSLFILVTGNTSQTAVAKAAEEDVDSYIIKPFTASSLRASLIRAIFNKIKPSEYMKTIDDGKALLTKGEIDAAIALFEKAKGMDPAPSLAMGYLGQAHQLRSLIEDAQTDYSNGLTYNKIHYKCLVGLYEVLMSKQKHAEAYQVIKRVSQYFPANPARLSSVLRLAIITKSYEDVEKYYQIFTSIDERNDEIIKYICAALVVCGKHYLQQRLPTRALELFQKAAATGQGRTKILREIIASFAEFNHMSQATEFLARFPFDTRTTADYLYCELLILDRTAHADRIIERARAIVGKSAAEDPMIHTILIRRLVETNRLDAAEEAIIQASRRWPHQADQFKKMFSAPTDGKTA